MAVANLNPQIVATLKDPGLYWDQALKGFGLNVRRDARGNIRRSWIVQYRVKGSKQQRKEKLGDAAVLTAKMARERAKEIFADVTKGRDPQGERKAAKQTDRSMVPTLTLRAALEKYIAMKEKEVREGTYRDISLKITKLYLLGARYFGPLHEVDINAITRQAVAARLADIREARSDTTAGRARAQLRAAFIRLMQEGLAEANPCIGTKGQTVRSKRDRPLSEDEIRLVWNCCDMTTDYGRIVRLLILTGCRREEIGGLRWSEIDFNINRICLPGERTKNGRPHTLTLPKMAMDILASVERMHDRDYLFGVRSVGFRSWQREKARFKDGITNPWRLHDLRHTVCTHMAEIGIAPHIIEAVVNHQSGHKAGIAGHYNHATYKEPMEIALAKWAAHVSEIIDGVERKVIVFPQSA
jgi:integrase